MIIRRRRRLISKRKSPCPTAHRQVETLNDGWNKWSAIPLKHAYEYEQRGETLRPLQDACQIKVVNKPTIEVKKPHPKPDTDYLSLAIKAAKTLNQKTSLEQIDKVAKDLFKFDIDPHLHITMPDVIAQEIFNWIVTLKDRPMFEQERLKLARKFIASLASESSPVEKPDVL